MHISFSKKLPGRTGELFQHFLQEAVQGASKDGLKA